MNATRRDAVLRIRIGDTSGGRLELVMQDGPGQQLLNVLLPRSAASAAQELAETLLAFKDPLPDEPLDDWGVLNDALDALYSAGVQYANGFLGGQTPLDEIVSVFREKLSLDPIADDPPLVEVQSDSDLLLPLELLPWCDWRWPGAVTDETSRDLAASCFLGFACILRRTPMSSLAQNIELRSRPLQLRVFQYADMEGARREQGFLGRWSEHVSIRGPWPDGPVLMQEAAERLSHHLRDPAYAGDSPDQIHRFACHCYTRGGPWNWSLELAGPHESPVEITATALNRALRDRRREQQRADCDDLPLVFMNACGSSRISVDSASSFPQLFLGNGNRGFIGTEVEVPDLFAAHFARAFYRSLLCGKPLGMALHRAKWEMLEDWSSPLGILYILYADPDIHVQHPIAMEALDE